jgi:hypothetical protein
MSFSAIFALVNDWLTNMVNERLRGAQSFHVKHPPVAAILTGDGGLAKTTALLEHRRCRSKRDTT